MTTRTELESRDNWQATFRLTRKPAPAFDCLMRTLNGKGLYWQHPDYKGRYLSGSTMAFGTSYFRDALKRGSLELVAGELPDLQEEPTP